MTLFPFAIHYEFMFEKFKNMLNNGRTKEKIIKDGKFVLGSIGNSFNNPLLGSATGSYDNNFPSITKIAEGFAEVMPYAVDDRGERLKTPPQLIKALYNPNKEMSGVKFFETLCTMALVHPTVYILCWRNENGEAVAGGDITEKNIAGFTFLESPTVDYDKGTNTIIYRKGTQQYTDKEVLAISLNVNPYSVTAGYSPSLAVKKWASIDDYIADYQGGFFRNGAIPEGQFVITARSTDEFNDIVDYLQKQHHGPKNSGKVNYVHRTVNDLGQSGNAQIEWIPYGTNNKDLDLQPIFDQANKKIDMTFGVPQEVKGYLENSNYASAQVADYIFARRVLYPKLVKIWAEFTHEMNRVTGGLGFAISFDFEMPMLSDEQKVRAETEQINLNNLMNAVNGGYTLESAVNALGLSKDYLKLEETKPQDDEEAPEVIENDSNTADQTITSTKRLKVPNIELKYKLPLADPMFERSIRDYMQKQIDAAIAEIKFDTKAEADAFAEKMWDDLEPIIKRFGANKYYEGYGMVAEAIGMAVDATEYAISKELKKSYNKYLKDVSLSYTEDTGTSIRRVLERGDLESWDNSRLHNELHNIMNTDEWRVQRLARTETHRAEQAGGLDGMRAVENETGVEFYKVWHVNPGTSNHCSDCEAMDGQRLPLGKDFGEFAAGFDEGADAHPNCNCYLTYEIAKVPQKSVKVTCPKCGRYMCESTGGTMKNIICGNSKCKRHYDITVKNGKIEAKERSKK